MFVLEGLAVVSDLAYEHLDRQIIFDRAKREAERLGLPLVNYGCKTKEPFVSQSDLNLDIVPRDVPNFELIDRDGRIPLPDNSAVVFASHVLEHVDDPEKVLRELNRVGRAYVVLPVSWSIANWANPKHKRIITRYGTLERPSSYAIPFIVGVNTIALII